VAANCAVVLYDFPAPAGFCHDHKPAGSIRIACLEQAHEGIVARWRDTFRRQGGPMAERHKFGPSPGAGYIQSG
jgi:hypothetical protein